MNAAEILRDLSKLGTESIKLTHLRHGAREPLFGVKVGDLKVIQKKIKKDHALSLELYSTGNSDAMYLAGLIADEKKISKKDLESWALQASWSMISSSVVAPVAAESDHGWELGLKWIDSKDKKLQATGWNTLSHVVSIKPNAALDEAALRAIVARIEATLQQSTDSVRYAMNGFLISLGSYVPALTSDCKRAAKKIGVVTVDMGETACKVPDAFRYIEKIEKMGRIGKKRKAARC